MNADRRPLLHRRDVLLTGAALGLTAAAPLGAFAAEKAVTDTRLAALLDAFVEEMLVDDPETATSIGLDKGPRAALKSRLNDRSAAGRARQVAGYADRAKRLRAVPRGSLSGRDLTTYDTVLYGMDLGAEGGRFAYGRDVANPYVVSHVTGADNTAQVAEPTTAALAHLAQRVVAIATRLAT